MAEYLIAIWPIAGHYNPGLALAHALRERGHEVAFYTGARARGLIEAEGFRVFPFRRVDESSVDRVFFGEADDSWVTHHFRQSRRLRDWIVGMLPEQVEDLADLLRRWRPDGIVCDWSMWGPYAIVGERHDLPVAIFQFQAGCFIPGPGAPPPGFGLPPPRTAVTRLIARLARGAVTAMTVDLRRTANRVRAAHGLTPLSMTVSELAGRMPLYLVTSVPELDYRRTDLPGSVHYVGACVWDKPRGEPAPAWLSELRRDLPIVHVSEGTIHARAPRLLKAAAAGLADRPMQVVMTTGTHRRPAELGLDPLAANIMVEPWIAHSDLLPRTDVVVTTGGAGTVLASLSAGVPVLVIPTEWDKPETARRVVEAGVGLHLSPRRCTPARVRAHVERLLEDMSFRERARHLSRVLAESGGARKAAELVERCLRPAPAAGAPAAAASAR
jgi:MGT family glycosyltransferase